MTVASSSWDARAGQVSRSLSKNKRSKAAVASAGTGLQVVAVLFAVRVGYKLARSGRALSLRAVLIMTLGSDVCADLHRCLASPQRVGYYLNQVGCL